MEIKHTLGPWEMLPTVIDGEEPGVCIVGSNLGGLVGAALPWPTEIESGDFSRVEANARMMAAAPVMLADLIETEKMLRWYGDMHAAKHDLEKAARNYLMADRLAATIALATPTTETRA